MVWCDSHRSVEVTWFGGSHVVWWKSHIYVGVTQFGRGGASLRSVDEDTPFRAGGHGPEGYKCT